MSELNLEKYQLKRILMGHQDTSRDPDKPQSGRYAEITFKLFLFHTTSDNENPLHYQMTQPIAMVHHMILSHLFSYAMYLI